MTDDRSLERAARSWLEEGPTRAPDRPVEAALARIQTTSQERDLRIPWRYQHMNNALRIAVGAAAVAVAALVAVNLVPDQPDPGAGTLPPSSASSQSANPSGSPAPTVLIQEGPLTAGTYVTHSVFPVQVTLTVPDGWNADSLGADATILGSEAAYLGLWIAQDGNRDPCGLGGVGELPVGPTAADLAAALAAAPGFDTTGPVDTSIGGLDGLYVELIGPSAECTEFELWSSPSSCRCQTGGNHTDRNRLWIVDVDGTRLAVNILHGDPTDIPAAALAELEAIVGSIQISR
jgi:hypothetical protein